MLKFNLQLFHHKVNSEWIERLTVFHFLRDYKFWGFHDWIPPCLPIGDNHSPEMWKIFLVFHREMLTFRLQIKLVTLHDFIQFSEILLLFPMKSNSFSQRSWVVSASHPSSFPGACMVLGSSCCKGDSACLDEGVAIIMSDVWNCRLWCSWDAAPYCDSRGEESLIFSGATNPGSMET